MFHLTSQSIVPFSSLLVYVILIVVVTFSERGKSKNLFSLFLITSAGWSLTSLLMNTKLPYEQLSFWKMMVPLFSTLSMVAYIYFIATCISRHIKKIARAGYIWLTVTSILIVFGYYTQGLTPLSGNIIAAHYSQILHYVILINSLIPAIMVFFVIRKLKNAFDPEERNRIAFLLAGLSLMLTVSIFSIILETNYAFFHLAYTGNAILITYALLKDRLLDIQLVMKKWLVYTGVTVCVTIAFFALLLVVSNLLRLLPPHFGIPITVAMVILFASLYNWLKSILDKGADRLFYGNRQIHRQILLNFAGKMSNFIDMKEIADSLLGPLAKAVLAKQTSLLLPVKDYFVTSYVARMHDEEQVTPFMLHRNSKLARWLEDVGTPLLRESIENNLEFEGLSQEEKNEINAAHIGLMCPIKSKNKLIGILALSEKQPPGPYSRDDVDLVSRMANESGIAIENAQMYTSAKEQADRDGLTGLYNHRYFQERLDQEIEKCSRSSDSFSLLFIDLDFFKTYNDNYGHVLGDEILKEVGFIIRDTIRSTDVGCRYGGDEFAVILFQTSLENAYKVAERIRQKLEILMGDQWNVLSCSIGVAGWHTDGIMRGQLLQAADNALHHAKQAGGNRVCLASEIDIKDSALPGTTLKPDNNEAITSIVYALAATVDARDHNTYGHSQAVSKYATDIAKAVGYREKDLERIRGAALLHDIGKLNLPDNILTKKSPLSDEEWELIKLHPDFGVNILKHIVGLRDYLGAIRFHHEHYNGTGYPKKLRGKDIPLDARIIAVADAYDAMTSERSYKEGSLSEAEATKELVRCAGTQFDPDLVNIFVELFQNSQVLTSGFSEELSGV
jgi:diguanylate cyclase (GGDEF)-like protein/putative nucleotidyltransferase with HDIG domain